MCLGKAHGSNQRRREKRRHELCPTFSWKFVQEDRSFYTKLEPWGRIHCHKELLSGSKWEFSDITDTFYILGRAVRIYTSFLVPLELVIEESESLIENWILRRSNLIIEAQYEWLWQKQRT
jgi:hypothetical protein